MPIITSALAAMQQNAQSPALKRKIERLGDRRGIEKHLWFSTLSQIRQPSVPGPKMIVARQYGPEATENTVMEHNSGSDLVCFGEDLFSTDPQGGINCGADVSSMEEPPSIVQIHYDALENVAPFTETFAAARSNAGGRMYSLEGAEGPIAFGSGFFT